jgi:predicted LPLAT superfamily acyltransferase
VSAAAATHWAALGESTFVAGIRVLAWVHRLLGRTPFRIVLLPVLAWMLLARPSARRASRQYLERVQAARGSLGHAPGLRDVLRHFAAFGETLLDKLLATSGRYPFERVQVDGTLPGAAGQQGGVIVTGHIGCLELCQALGERQPGLELAVLVHTRHAPRFNALLRRLHPARRIELLQVTELDPGQAERLGALVARGGWVAIVGDRVPVNAGKTLDHPFLGHAAPWPVGAYVLAALWRCPLVFMACVRRGDHHRLLLRELSSAVVLPRRERTAALAALLAAYVGAVEAVVADAPFEWFNFFDFWAQPAGPGRLPA